MGSSTLRIIVFQEDEWLCAQFVDFDLATQAGTLPQLYKAIHKLIRGHIAVRESYGLPAFKDLPPAPDKFREMFDRSKLALPTQLIRVTPRGKALPQEVRIAATAAA